MRRCILGAKERGRKKNNRSRRCHGTKLSLIVTVVAERLCYSRKFIQILKKGIIRQRVHGIIFGEEDGKEEQEDGKDGRKRGETGSFCLPLLYFERRQQTLKLCNIPVLREVETHLPFAIHMITIHQRNLLSRYHPARIFLRQTTGLVGRPFLGVEVALK